MKISWSAAGGTHVGRVREGNEDSFRLAPDRGIFLVADGMGGHAAGEVASAVAADVVLDYLAEAQPTASSARELIRQAFLSVRRVMVDRSLADSSLAGMGTTLTAAVVLNDASVHVGHIGDSRLYHLSQGQLAQITHDHTWTQEELDAGRITPEVARTHPFAHVLTRVLAVEEPAEPDLYATSVQPGDTLLLCSDGLHNMVDPDTILSILLTEAPAEVAVRKLIEAANRRGGMDNITAVVVRVGAVD